MARHCIDVSVGWRYHLRAQVLTASARLGAQSPDQSWYLRMTTARSAGKGCTAASCDTISRRGEKRRLGMQLRRGSMKRLSRAAAFWVLVVGALVASLASPAYATFHEWKISE